MHLNKTFKDNMSNLLSVSINSITIVYFTLMPTNIYLSNWMTIYEVIIWVMAILLTIGFFGTAYAFQKLIDEEDDNKVLAEKLESFQSITEALDKSEKPLPTLVKYWWYSAIIVIGVVGGDLSLFFPCFVSALSIGGMKKVFKTKILEIEEKLLTNV